MSALNKNVVREALSAIAEANGGKLTPEMVVQEAKSEASPLHTYFEWDTSKAAEKHWLDQARSLIRSVRVMITHNDKMIETVAYVRDPRLAADEQGYMAVADIRTDADLARDALVYEFSRAAAFLRRARELAAAFDMTGEVDVAVENVEGMRRRVADTAGVATVADMTRTG